MTKKYIVVGTVYAQSCELSKFRHAVNNLGSCAPPGVRASTCQLCTCEHMRANFLNCPDIHKETVTQTQLHLNNLISNTISSRCWRFPENMCSLHTARFMWIILFKVKVKLKLINPKRYVFHFVRTVNNQANYT